MSSKLKYMTRGGVAVERTTKELDYSVGISGLMQDIDEVPGVILTSSYEFPGRYDRWDIGFVAPPLRLDGFGRNFVCAALSDRGCAILAIVAQCLAQLDCVTELEVAQDRVSGAVEQPTAMFPEEARCRQPSLFSIVRALVDLFGAKDDASLGLFGAFGYDLAFQFEPIQQRKPRSFDQRDLVLYLPDTLILVDHRKETAVELRYEFTSGEHTTRAHARDVPREAYHGSPAQLAREHPPGGYAKLVELAREEFAAGNLFEAVPTQMFSIGCPQRPSEVFRHLCAQNPAPFGGILNLGSGEYLVSASPEMFVRVTNGRVETCPISGTIARGADAIADADRIRKLLNSEKDEAELTMCTDVDRNDKARVCRPETIKVVGRRQIELYSRLIHTVDHVEGYLAEGYDALDALLSHAWAVTVTGAPKAWAMQFLEQLEPTPRRWYGGTFGSVLFNGDLNTGLTLRTIRIAEGIAEVRAGATLLYDSIPAEEERETELKASALIDALRGTSSPSHAGIVKPSPSAADRPKVMLVDHHDSFVHMLGGYFRIAGANVVTLRPELARQRLAESGCDLVVLSPGPGRPNDFGLSETLDLAIGLGLPVFGVCLGLQGIVEYFGGQLDRLHVPQHGRSSKVHLRGGLLFEGLGDSVVAGRYHSLYARRDTLPVFLNETATSDDGVIMAVEHRDLPISGVQFHPESIMSAVADEGLELIRNVLRLYTN